ncbi:MAG: hypothetical protein KC912_05295 [Proteobacteria bacterium]|nr:hypothetical protein [Pseudomonadota bacterium]
MDLFDSPEELERQLGLSRDALDTLDASGDNSVVLERLKTTKPNHPLLWAKTLFALGFFGGLIGGGLLIAVPLVQPDLAKDFQVMQASLGLAPSAIAFAAAGISMVMWIVIAQLTLIVARSEEPLEWEAKERQRLTSDMARIKAAIQLHEQAPAGTPLGALPRGGTPMGAPPMGMLGSATPPPLPGMRMATPAPAPTASGPGNLLQSLGTKTRGGTPLGAAPRGGTPIGGAGRAIGSGSPNMSYSGPSEGFADFDDDGDFPNFDALAPSPSVGQPSYVAAESESVRPEMIGGRPSGFSKPMATVFPPWAPVEEPWLLDAIEKCYALAQELPLQAAITFDQDTNLPFTLALERASPAIAMRATMAYADYLAKIVTPVRARVDLSAVPHLSGSFTRNVMSALEPHFGDGFVAEKKGDLIEIRFGSPNSGWNRYPVLPTA